MSNISTLKSICTLAKETSPLQAMKTLGYKGRSSSNDEYTNVKVPTITMDELTKLQNDYVFFTDMLKSLERKKKKTPGNGFAKMNCKERMRSNL